MEYAILILAICLVVFMSVFLINTFAKKKKPLVDESATEKKDEKASETAVKNDIPDILKEVTQGNYMYDLAHAQGDELSEEDIPETTAIEDHLVKNETVDEAFHRIEAIETNEDELLDTQSILDEMDGVIRSDKEELKEIRGLSKKTKAILISDILKKNKNNLN